MSLDPPDEDFSQETEAEDDGAFILAASVAQKNYETFIDLLANLALSLLPPLPVCGSFSCS